MILTLVVARADNGVIGQGNALPWHLPADLRHFRRLTLGKPVVMGRRTFEAIGRPLPGRHNIVLTRSAGWRAPGVTVAADLAAAVAAGLAEIVAAGVPEVAAAGVEPDASEIMIIGGAAVYAEALPSARRIHLTEVHAAPAGDTFLPPFPPVWRETAREAFPAEGDAPAYSFVTLERD